MLGNKLIKAAAGNAGGAAADPNFNQTTLLLHGDGTNGAQNNTFLDSSTNNFTITRNGNTTQGSFSPFSVADGEFSNYFDGTGDSLSWSGTTLAGDFTVECWVYKTATDASGYTNVFSHSIQNTQLTFDNTTAGSVGLVISASVVISPSGTAVTANAWHHIAWVREGSTCRVYVNGVQQGTGTSSTSMSLSFIGQFRDGGFEMNGYISNARIVAGTCLYPSGTTFTPSTTPLTAIANTSLLTCQSNRFKDNSTNNFAITVNGNTSVQPFSPFAPSAAYSPSVNGGSGYFDGSGDYLTSSITGLSGEFTVEFWSYRPAAGINYFFSIGDSSNSNAGEIYIGSSGTQLNYYADNAIKINGGTPPPAGVWNYFALTRDSSDVVRMYVNGTQVGGTYTQSGTLSTSLYIGAEFYTGSVTGVANGYLGPFRISDTVRTVTSVPTAPFASDGNTVFLANYTNAGIFDNTGKNNLETVGNAQIDTSVVKYGTGSMEFDGTGDMVRVVNAGVTTGFGTGDFTVEFWVYANSWSAYNNLVDFRKSNNYFLIIYEGGAIKYYNAGYKITGSSLSTGQWYHIALARSGTSTKLFIDGTQSGSTYSDSTNYPTETVITIGARNDDAGNPFNGFIDDLRITKGVARYTANFTPPSAPFEDQ